MTKILYKTKQLLYDFCYVVMCVCVSASAKFSSTCLMMAPKPR